MKNPNPAPNGIQKSPLSFCPGLAAALIFLATLSAHAQSYTWTSTVGGTSITDGAGTWSTSAADWLLNGTGTAGNWVSGNAVIGNGGTGGIITVGSAVTVGSITFASGSSGYDVASNSTSMASSTVTLSGTPTITNNETLAVINAPLAGGFNLVSSATANKLTLTGNNTGSGITLTVNSGILDMAGASAPELPDATAIIVNSGGVFLADWIASPGSTVGYAATVNSGGTLTIQSAATSSFLGGKAADELLNLNGGTVDAHAVGKSPPMAVNLEADSTLGTVANPNSATWSGTWAIDNGTRQLTVNAPMTISGAISGSSGGLTINSTNNSTLTLGGANTYPGTTTFKAGIANADKAETAGTSGPFGKSAAANPGSMVFSGGTLQYSSANANDYSGRFSTAASQPISIDLNDQPVTFATQIQGTGTSLALTNAAAGGNTLTLGFAGTEGYTGPTTIYSNTLALAASCNLNAASGVVIGAGGTFNVSAQTSWSPGGSAVPALTASGTATPATIAGGTTVALGAAPVTLNWDGTDDTMLTISSGVLTMSGGTITINGGPMSVGTHNIIAVTGGSITESSISVNGTAVAGDIVTVTTTGGTPNYLQINVQTGLATVTSPTSSAVGATTATLGATVTGNGGQTITDYGIVWSTSPNPTIANNKISAGSTPTLNTPYTVNATGLPAATTIYYAGYATTVNGTGYSSSATIATPAAPPTVQDTGATFSSVQGGSATVSWTRGNGTGCIVLVSSGTAVNASPANGGAYTANANFGTGTQVGTGNYVAFIGAGNSVTLTALSPGTTYYVAVYESNGSGGSAGYLTTSPATASQATVAHPVTYYSGSTATDPTATASWWTGSNNTGAQPANFTGGDTFIVQSGQTLTVNAPSTPWTVSGGATLQVNGTLAVTPSTTSGTTIKLGGNFIQDGTFETTAPNDGVTLEFTSNGAWTGSGDLSANAANAKINVTVDAGVTLTASNTSSGFKLGSSNTKGITVNGTLDMGALTVNGNSSGSAFFTLGTGGTLITATTSASGLPGIFTGFSANKITLPATASYTFDGAAAQVTGTSANNATMPATVNNLTINNSAGVTFSQTTAVTNMLNILGGTLTPSGTGDTAGVLTFNGSTHQASGTWGSTSSPATHQNNTYFAGTGYVTVSSSGPSGPGSITNSLSGSTLTLTWPAGQSWRLVSQTNSLSVGLTTNGWATVPGGVDGSISITVNPANPTVFYRLTYP